VPFTVENTRQKTH